MLFCPHCGNMLLVESGAPSAGGGGGGPSSSAAASAPSAASAGGALRFFCQTCPYVQPLARTLTKRLPLTRKRVDDVLGGEGAWANVDQTDAGCPACGNGRAYFQQIQIRSADEPMTTFYKCTACAKTWNDR